MAAGSLLLLLLAGLLIGALPGWPHSRRWGYGPSAGLGALLLAAVLVLSAGRL